MKLDSSCSHPAASGATRFHHNGNRAFPQGTHVPEPENNAGPEIKKYSTVNAETALRKPRATHDDPTSWSYLYVHNQKVKSIEKQLHDDGRTCFIHRTIKYVPRKTSGVREVSVPSVSGLIFLQGLPRQLQAYLDERIPHHKLCKNCSTGRTARIPNNQMQAFMRVAETEPERIRFLLRPFAYYAKNRTLLRITSGTLAGLEGYVIRMARDRKLVMDVGGISVAIAGIHAERFEEVGKNENDSFGRATFYKRNLHERNAFIDRYFHPIRTPQEVAAQADNITLLHHQTLRDLAEEMLDTKEAYEILSFIIEEIGYYYAPIFDRFQNELQPILRAGVGVMQEIGRIIADPGIHESYRQRWEAEAEALRNNYAYLFEPVI